jgi:hypothetical protein
MENIGDRWFSPDHRPHTITRIWTVAGTRIPSHYEVQDEEGNRLTVPRREMWSRWYTEGERHARRRELG